MEGIAARISQLMLSKALVAPNNTQVQRVADDGRESDEADRFALEICLAICVEDEIALDQAAVARIIRSAMKRIRSAENRRADRIAEAKAALLVAGFAASGGDPMNQIKNAILAPASDMRVLGMKPIKPEDVCLSCSENRPRNIRIRTLAHSSPSPAQLKQAKKIEDVVGKRLERLGLAGCAAACVVMHRGSCKMHGSEDRHEGDGVAECPGIRVTVDLGDEVIVEEKFEVR